MSSAPSEHPITVYGAIAASAVIAVSKFGAGMISGSSAMLSEGIHSPSSAQSRHRVSAQSVGVAGDGRGGPFGG
jgi:hypothetical protein